MPNVITHTIFAETVLAEMENEKYKNWILKHKEEYLIGCNGPDFLFFHDVFPLTRKRDMRLSKLGSKLHAKKINCFYDRAIKEYFKTKEGTLKEASASYLIAHYLHWQLDSIMHPYVVYRTGFNEPLSSPYHHRFESMMDTMLLKKYKNTSIKTYKTYENTKRSINTVEVISNLYIPCIKACFNESVQSTDIKKALEDWEKAQKYLYDPYAIKFKCIQFIEKIIKKPWALSGNIVLPKVDEHYDVLNINKTTWHHPITNSPSNKSVEELMQEACEETKKGLPILFTAMENGNTEAFLAFLADRSYGNGVAGKVVRKYKKVIYEEKTDD